MTQRFLEPSETNAPTNHGEHACCRHAPQWLPLLGIFLLLAAAACTSNGPSDNGQSADYTPEGSEWQNGEDSTEGSAGPQNFLADLLGGAAGAILSLVEVCDGRDNDHDGEVDEGTAGIACKTKSQRDGTTYCIQGMEACWECDPRPPAGSAEKVTRIMPCGTCAFQRVDVCNYSGEWQVGACDGCSAQEPPPAECNPNATQEIMRVRYQRLDGCPGAGDGAACTVNRYVCNTEGKWVLDKGCAALMSPECSPDQKKRIPCGRCGTMELICDGCVWKRTVCEDEGICDPGAHRDVPCQAEGCAPGLTSTITCNDQCDWEPPTGCTGCVLGRTYQQTFEPCLPDYQCGERKRRLVCEAEVSSASSATLCSPAVSLQRGFLREYVEGCTNLCTPGSTTQGGSCTTTGTNLPGTLVTECSDTCQQVSAGCQANANTCAATFPTTTTTKVCGSGDCAKLYNYTTTTKCVDNYIQVSDDKSSQCPKCENGQQQYVSCTPSSPQSPCGQALKTCSGCAWGTPGECTPKPGSCVPVPGDKLDVQTLQCGEGTCGATYQEWKECSSNGCGFTVKNDRSSKCIGECTQGQTQTQQCSGAASCQQQARACSGSCTWGAWGACSLVQPAECNTGSTRVVPCTIACGTAVYSGNQSQTCSACAWTNTGGCVVSDERYCSVVGQEKTDTCPGTACGSLTSRCSSSCTWTLISNTCSDKCY